MPNMTVLYTPEGQPYTLGANGKKSFVSPNDAASMWGEPKALAWAKKQGFDNSAIVKPDGTPYNEDEVNPNLQPTVDANGVVHQVDGGKVIGRPAPTGGAFHESDRWNAETGKYESGGWDWGNLLTLVVGGFLTAGAASAIMSGTATTMQVTAAASAASQAGLPAAAVLPSTVLAPVMGTLPAVAASGAVPAALGGAGTTSALAGLAGGEGATIGTGGLVLAPDVAATTGLSTAGIAGGGSAAAGGAAGISDLVGSGEAAVEDSVVPATDAATSSFGQLPATDIGNGMMDGLPNVAPSGGVTSALAGTSGLGSTLRNVYKTGSTLSDVLNTAGAGVNAATQAAGQTQLQNALMGLTANGQNITGNSAFENELMNRAELEAKQRKGGLANIYRESRIENPRVSPFDPAGAPKYSDNYKSALHQLSAQGAEDIATPVQYDVKTLPKLKAYTDYNPNTISGAGGTEPSTLQTIGNYLGPTLSTTAALAKLFNW